MSLFAVLSITLLWMAWYLFDAPYDIPPAPAETTTTFLDTDTAKETLLMIQTIKDVQGPEFASPDPAAATKETELDAWEILA